MCGEQAIEGFGGITIPGAVSTVPKASRVSSMCAWQELLPGCVGMENGKGRWQSWRAGW
jgi:hypothetical protein